MDTDTETKFMVRQGDVLIMDPTILKIPVMLDEEALAAIPARDGRTILADGEVTGHAHALSADWSQLYEIPEAPERTRALKIVAKSGADTVLKHEEHAKIRIPPGIHIVRTQREYVPEGEMDVAD